MTLPGILYYDLAFDIQRTMQFECLLSMLPPSAAVIILRSVCTMESLSLPLLITTTSLVSNVPIYFHMLALCLDCLLYYILALICSSFQYKLPRKQFITPNDMLRNNHLQYMYSHDYFNDWLSNILQYIWPHRSDNNNCHNSFQYEVIENNNEVNDKSFKHHSDEMSVGLVISDVSKSFVSTENEYLINVLHHIRATLFSGCVTTLLGSNGGGKTTLMRILGGFDSSYFGNIYYIKEANESRRIVGWCSQSDALYSYLTIREHIELFCDLLSINNVSLSTIIFPNNNYQIDAEKNNFNISDEITILLTKLGLLGITKYYY
jgi:hypothetical protein